MNKILLTISSISSLLTILSFAPSVYGQLITGSIAEWGFEGHTNSSSNTPDYTDSGFTVSDLTLGVGTSTPISAINQSDLVNDVFAINGVNSTTAANANLDPTVRAWYEFTITEAGGDVNDINRITFNAYRDNTDTDGTGPLDATGPENIQLRHDAAVAGFFTTIDTFTFDASDGPSGTIVFDNLASTIVGTPTSINFRLLIYHTFTNPAKEGRTLGEFGLGGDGNASVPDLYVSPVPEPSTYALIFGGIALGFVFLKRKLKKRDD